MDSEKLKKEPELMPGIISVLRGETVYSGSAKEVVECAVDFYRSGLEGEFEEFPLIPCPTEFNLRNWNALMRFVRMCWEQGCMDAAEEENQV